MDREPTGVASPGAGLLERASALATLEDAFAAGRGGEGRLVFVSGDAGIGKSALVRAFCSHSGAGARVLVGACDGLRTPRPLGPLADIGRVVGGRLGDATAMADPVQRVVPALLDELRSGPPTVVVIEDVHWADEATLDVLRHARRDAPSSSARSSIVDLPRRRAAAGPPAADRARRARDRGRVARIELPPLSVEAVATLAAPHGVDAASCTRKTGGQPVLRHRGARRGRDGHPGHGPRRRARAGARGSAPAARAAPRGGRDRPAARRSCGCSRRSPRGRWTTLDECLASGMLARRTRTPSRSGTSSRG